MSLDPRTRRKAGGLNMLLLWLAFGLAFQLVQFGLPHPLRLDTWLHVLFWPVYVLLRMLRWAFYPIAMVALIGFALIFAINARR